MAELRSLELFELDMDRTLTEAEQRSIVTSNIWRAALDSKIATLQATLQDSIGKQTRELRKQLDNREWHIFTNAPKGQSKFTGKIGVPVEQKGLE